MTTHVEKILAIVRSKVINGDYGDGARISEVAIAQELGVSRTPARTALAALEAEGLLKKREGRGYSARPILAQEVTKAIEVRAVLEGLAARNMAQNGMSPEVAKSLQASVSQTAALLASDDDSDLIGSYHEANIVFHETLMSGCGNEFIAHTFERIRRLPLTALGTLSFAKIVSPARERLRLTVGHSQHVIILDAMEKGEAARAEEMMREHSLATLNYSNLFVD